MQSTAPQPAASVLIARKANSVAPEAFLNELPNIGQAEFEGYYPQKSPQAAGTESTRIRRFPKKP
jgi:hypothetical protein